MKMDVLKIILGVEIALAVTALSVVGVRAFGNRNARVRLSKIASAILHPMGRTH